MTTFEAAILGIVQGLTEFLPVSSTAHLRLVPALAGWSDAGAGYTAVLQLGTLVAVIGYFARDLLGMARGGIAALASPARRQDPEARLLLAIIIGTIPVGLAGLAFRHAIEGVLRSLPVIAGALVVVALGLLAVEHKARQTRTIDLLTLRDAALVGCAQALALIPGVSRSGITLLAALMLGFARPDAARFSFLLSIPAVAAAGIFELPKVLRSENLAGVPLAVGLLFATLTGYATIAWLLRYLRTRTTRVFSYYRIGLGLLVLVVWAMGLAR